jgi:hypothetical protein
MADVGYTIIVGPGEKKRYIAGSYDMEKRTPNYSHTVMMACHAESDVIVKHFILPVGTDHKWIYDVHNTSSNIDAFVSILKDGVLILPVE